MFQVFTRNWWKDNPAWPRGLEPDPTATKSVLGYEATEEAARARCKEYNDANPPGRLGRKAEFSSRWR